MRRLIASAVVVLTNVSSAQAARRAEHFRHGINLSEWFAQVYDPRGYTKEHFETWTTAQDLALIRSMGFDHVRLSVNPEPMFRRRNADRIPGEYLGYLDAAVQSILDHDLAVEIDLHPESEFKHRMDDDGFVEELADFWRALAQHYAERDPERVVFEVMNEPEMRDRERWYGVENRLVAAIRAGAPHHTIIVAGARWSDDDDLLAMTPMRDTNLIYNFHFYEPHIFTHQGATWAVNFWHYLHGLPYPSDPANVMGAAALVPDPVDRLSVVRYGMDRWGPDRIAGEIAQVAAWASRWNVPVICNEFGVFRLAAAPRDRAAWIADTRMALERDGIGWTMWDYSGGFGVVTKPNGTPVPDPVTLRALGLYR
jgi:endoglucanase